MKSDKLLVEQNRIFGVYIVYLILKKLVTPFDKTDAYKLGIIDKNGNILRKRSTLETQQEKNAYTLLDGLVWKIKRLIERLPFGKSKLASYAAALWLIKESSNHEFYELHEDLFEEEFWNFMDGVDLSESEKNLAIELGGVAEEIANVTGPAVATDIPFKPMLKKPIRRLNLDFHSMYEEIMGGKNDTTNHPRSS